MTPFAAQIIGQLFEEARSDRARPYEETLSPEELEVLQFLTKGMTNKEIATTLRIAAKTVKSHLRNIQAKLHFANRVQAAAFGLDKTIVPQDDPAP